MLAGKTLFPTDVGRSSHVAIMTVIFGDFPLDLIKRGKYSDEFFRDGNFYSSIILPWADAGDISTGKFIVDIQERSPLPDKLKRMFSDVMDNAEIDQVNSFLGAMLKLQPHERDGPAKLADHRWLLD
jgi:hypothetical protein